MFESLPTPYIVTVVVLVLFAVVTYRKYTQSQDDLAQSKGDLATSQAGLSSCRATLSQQVPYQLKANNYYGHQLAAQVVAPQVVETVGNNGTVSCQQWCTNNKFPNGAVYALDSTHDTFVNPSAPLANNTTGNMVCGCLA